MTLDLTIEIKNGIIQATRQGKESKKTMHGIRESTHKLRTWWSSLQIWFLKKSNNSTTKRQSNLRKRSGVDFFSKKKKDTQMPNKHKKKYSRSLVSGEIQIWKAPWNTMSCPQHSCNSRAKLGDVACKEAEKWRVLWFPDRDSVSKTKQNTLILK